MSRLPGRPREFDTDAAIDSALLVFRERGYHATSIKELSDATGLTAGSLYKAFGSKNGLFLAAFDRYTRTRSAALRQRTEAARSGRDKIAAVLRFYAESSHGPEGIRGCLVVASATELAVLMRQPRSTSKPPCSVPSSCCSNWFRRASGTVAFPARCPRSKRHVIFSRCCRVTA